MTRRKPAPPVDDRLQLAIEAAAALLKVAPDSERAVHVAKLKIILDNETAAALAGARTNVANVLALDAALKSYLPADEGLQVNVHICETAVGIGHCVCPSCGVRSEHRFGENSLTPLPPAPIPEAPKPVETPSVAVAPPKPAPAPPRGRSILGADNNGIGNWMGGFRGARSGVAAMAFNDRNPDRNGF
jgi:hypothetical protein